MAGGYVLRWGWRLRLGGVAASLALAATSAWAWVDPRTSTLAAALATIAPILGVVVTLRLFRMRVRVDAEGLRGRYRFGERALPWSAVDAATLLRTYQRGATIIHEHVRDPAAAMHVILHERGGRGWAFNDWMSGFAELVAEVSRRGLVDRRGAAVAMTVDEASAGAHEEDEESLAARGLRGIERFNRGGAAVLSAFALLFVLVVGAFALTLSAGVRITGSWAVDLGLVAVGLFAALWGVSRVLSAIGAARFEAPPGGASRVDWMLNGAGLLGGILLLVAFIPRALAGGDRLWVELLIAAMAALLVYSAIASWLRGR
ncbi:MAG: PH domain-containing protein [Nannocystaceae bacterium]